MLLAALVALLLSACAAEPNATPSSRPAATPPLASTGGQAMRPLPETPEPGSPTSKSGSPAPQAQGRTDGEANGHGGSAGGGKAGGGTVGGDDSSGAVGDAAVWYAMFCWQAIGIAAEQHPAWRERLQPGRMFYAGIAAALGYDGADTRPLLSAASAAQGLYAAERGRFAEELRDCLLLIDDGVARRTSTAAPSAKDRALPR